MNVLSPTLNKPLQASCQCGKSHFSVKTRPLARFVCHCEVCQRFTGKAYSDVTVVLSKDVELTDISSTQFKRYKAPPNIRRGICSACHKPSIEFGIIDQLAFIPSPNYQDSSSLPPPSLHAFYHRRVCDVEDAAPKYEGFIKSQVAIISLLTKGIAQRVSGKK